MKEFFKGLLEGQKKFADHMSFFINVILLTVLYVVGVGITFVFVKIFGKKFLDMKFDKNLKSYFSDLNLSKKSREEYYRQF